ncbi:MAG: transporter [Bacteroidales bacterium]|nr:transporter [Bacteroidales bacterium]
MQKFRSLVLPIAIVAGLFCHHWLALARPMVPFLIFFILFLNFSAIEVRKLRLAPMHGWMLLFQAVVSLGLYFAIAPFDELLAQGVLVGILSPVAASVVVVACMLGADRASITTYSLVGNFGIAILAPIYFSFIGTNVSMPFVDSFLLILSKIGPTIVLPLLIIIVLQLVAPKVNNAIARFKGWSFYLWAVALMITIGQTIDFVFLHGEGNWHSIIWLSIASLLGCAIQFGVGHLIGNHYGDRIAGGQGLGQRNTALAIWMAGMYLQPLASIFPAAYSIWQNLYNSYQLWQHDRRGEMVETVKRLNG